MSLSSADIAHLEAVLAQGKKPKVVFTDAAGQVAGRAGKVVALDPAGVDDFVHVAFGSDELSFSAAELRLPAPGEGARRAPRQRASEPSEPVAPSGPGLLPDEPKPKPVSERKPVTAPEVSQPAVAAEVAAPKKKVARPRAAAAKHSELSITLTYEDGEWSIAATRGARTVVKGAKVAHSNALAMCQAAGSDEVAEVVDEVVEKIRSEAAEEASRLRRQLEEAEARLAELK
ncbi:hypothetical protein [Glycomyces algeriensis]|uniref:Uncharacterized protein n=1 Tax=Glycomyces algeriensis TaxID=256037 RepID=A0A9W6G9B6_9ACTN|nr:hypothetical protein [Glycomyces algeriensis]MDA1367373.1 hypothetical protein [Glycomyces algeriensis]MDR7350973.1 hypothetical protein [Glycomyces algeriensis]GLI43685.1 hypothetical protein GALLR39Z86_35350 [Glycomyces algeriensis]